MVSKGDYMSTDDLKKGYWQVRLNKNHRKYVGVSLDGRYYIANVLILGICDTVYAFTKLARQVVRYLRFHGVNTLFILMTSSFATYQSSFL